MNLIEEKAEAFAIRIIKLYKYLCKENKEYDLFRQLLRSGTSIGANVAEAESAISDRDFLAKMYIALKESNETLYWLRLLYKTSYYSDIEFKSIYADGEELKRMLTSITKTKCLKLNTQNSTFKTL